jgi:hypothetical protein
MNMSFLPGDLHLSQSPNGQFVLRMAGREILSTKSQRTAVAKFNALRSELETKFPARQPSSEEKAKLLQREISNSLLARKKGAKAKKKTTAGGTRSFGG